MATKTEAQKSAESYSVEEIPEAINSRIEQDARWDRAGNYNTPLARYNRGCIKALRARLVQS